MSLPSKWVGALALAGLALAGASPRAGAQVIRVPNTRIPPPANPVRGGMPPATVPATPRGLPGPQAGAAPGVAAPNLNAITNPGLIRPATGVPVSQLIPTVNVNPNFQIAPGLSLPQAAFNTMVIGRALSAIPPYALGFNPYPPTVVGSYSGVGGGLATGGYGGLSGLATGGYGGYGGAMMTTGMYGGYNSMGAGMMANPYGGQAMMSPYAGAAASYPTASASEGVSDARVVKPPDQSLLVSPAKPQRPDQTQDVWLYDNFFSPATVMVKAGTTVRWINYGQHNHSVTSTDGAWDSGPMRRGAEFSVTLNQPGTYRYICRFHPGQMSGTITVTK